MKTLFSMTQPWTRAIVSRIPESLSRAKLSRIVTLFAPMPWKTSAWAQLLSGLLIRSNVLRSTVTLSASVKIASFGSRAKWLPRMSTLRSGPCSPVTIQRPTPSSALPGGPGRSWIVLPMKRRSRLGRTCVATVRSLRTRSMWSLPKKMRLLSPANRSPWKRQWLEFVAVKPLSVAVSFGAERIVTKRVRRSAWIARRG